MAIKKGDSLKSMILADYFNIVQATEYAVKDKSIHFRNGENYLGYIIRSTNNQKVDIDWNQPVLLDGKHGADWLGVTPQMEWKTK